ncbi:MAG: DUF368 domain-containing protein, partial [Bacilli bacterium]
ITLLVLSKVIHFFIDRYPLPTSFFFLGLIIAMIPFFVRDFRVSIVFKGVEWALVAVCISFLVVMAFLPETAVATVDLSNPLFWLYSIAGGALASMAMLLPGISGSFVLVLIGLYPVAIEALATLNLPVIALIGAGVVSGFVLSAKLIRYCLTYFQTKTHAVIFGLISGSTIVVFPGIPADTMTWVYSVIAFALGIVVVTVLNKRQA